MGELQWVRYRDTGFYEARDARGLRYECRWTPYGTRKTWQLFIDGDRVALAFSSRLMDVQRYGQEAANLYAPCSGCQNSRA